MPLIADPLSQRDGGRAWFFTTDAIGLKLTSWMSASRTLKTVKALLRPVLLGIAMAEAGLLVVRTCVSSSDLHNTNDVVGNYLQTLGTIYAVLLAFVVYVVWSQFNETRTYV